jgi:hypothetical protein
VTRVLPLAAKYFHADTIGGANSRFSHWFAPESCYFSILNGFWLADFGKLPVGVMKYSKM